MENSTSSSPSKVVRPAESGCDTVDSQEESGWTQYIDYFDANNNQMEIEESVCTASMVSDAGSNPEWKQKLINYTPNFSKKLNFKTKRTQEISADDSLEDTASSPVHSPKITMNFKNMNLNSRQLSDDHENYMVEGGISIDKHTRYTYTNAQQNPGIDNVGFTELKKKGLCLVPISMVIDNLD